MRMLTWGSAAVVVGAGATLAVAPFLTAQGPSGFDWPFPGSVMDLLPVYGKVLVATGVAIAVLTIVAAARRSIGVAALTCVVPVIAAGSLNVVRVSYRDEIVERGATLFGLRGPAPWTAAIACLVALAGALLLLAVIAADDAGPPRR